MVLQIHWQLILLIIFFIKDLTAQKTCTFSVNTDMERKAPMLISITDAKTIFEPNNKNGDVKMNSGDQVYLACPGTTNTVDSYGTKMVTAKCSSGKMFLINGQLTSIANIKCRQHPMSYSNVIGKCAGNRGDYIEVGFQFNNLKNPQMLICFNSQEMRTFWTKAMVSRVNSYICPVNSISFDRTYFGTINPDDRYRQQHRCLPSNYIIPKNAFEKGHLIAKCDFLDAASKRMTYYYINTAPQWKSFNGGNWRNLETTVRKKAEENNPGLYVYTGTHELLKLDNTSISLDSSGKMTVPLYFWKVVVERRSGKGVAFVGVNDPFHLYPSICPDECGQISWLGNFANLRKNQQNGIVYCCTVEKLQKVPNIVLPTFAEYRSGLLD